MLSDYGTIISIIVTTIFGFIIYKVLDNYFNNLIYKNSNYLENLARIKEFLKEVNSFKDYVNWVEKKQIKNSYQKLGIFFRDKTNFYKKEPLVKKFNDIYQNFDAFIIKQNKDFVNTQKENLKSFFDDIEGKKLDEQQRNAIITNEYSNLVIAGAGSGKTLTIIGKVKYLLEDRKIKPEDILLLSFTRKTVDELNERLKQLKIKPLAKTFHELGKKIINSQNKNSPTVTNENTLLNVISEFLNNEASNNELVSNAYLEYLGCYMNIPKEMDEFESLGDKIEEEKGLELETLKSKYHLKNLSGKNKLNTIQGEKVKSVEELTIANFLFLHGINYVYEKKYPHTDYNYQPDFYLTEHDIYLEHFGVNEDNRAPWLNSYKEREYVENMEHKKKTHKQYETKLICTYSYYNRNNMLLNKLAEILESNGIELKEINTDEVYEKIKQNDKDFGSELIGLIKSFISLCKSRDLDKSSIINLYRTVSNNQSKFYNKRQSLFLTFTMPIFEKYNSLLEERNEIDFNDMINQATKSVSNCENDFDYKYIIVDEYQDISYSRFNLIKEIRDKNNATIMCVGDDWQSIYRFAGSDISLFNDFEYYFGQSEQLLIEKTYRNSQNLIDASKNFILKNKNQIVKNPNSEKKNITHPIKFIYFNNNLEEEFINQIKILKDKYGEKPILVLGRHSRDLKNLIKSSKNSRINHNTRQNKIKIKDFPDLEVNFLTVHSSKGIEAENVIILNLENDLYGFPNKLSDDRILEPLMSKAEDYSHSEERRLFYVALTRTKNEVVLMINQNESVFINELIKDNSEAIFKNLDNKIVNCHYCKKGVLEIKINKSDNSQFLGCSNYPICTETINDVSIIENSKLCPNCFSGYVIQKSSKHGKFWSCTNYPYCSWKSK